jgi:hypothetical protein
MRLATSKARMPTVLCFLLGPAGGAPEPPEDDLAEDIAERTLVSHDSRGAMGILEVSMMSVVEKQVLAAAAPPPPRGRGRKQGGS